MTRTLQALALFFAASALATPAFAQVGFGTGGQGAGQKDDDAKATAKPAPPPAIPGAAANPDAVIPADKSVAEMSPNDALFDAVQRGDIVAAREAVSRGAQLDARNVLGETPLDVSVDLNRNDITFLLLSLRTPPATTPPDSLPGHAAPAVTAAASRKRGAHTARLAANRPAPATPDQRYASDGGTPKPDAGFLGFGR